MHELDIAMTIVTDVCEIRRKQYPGLDIVRISIDIGDLSGVDAESLKAVFPIVSTGTEIVGARLELNRVRARLICLDCRKECDFEYPHYFCPGCGSFSIEVKGGKEMIIKSFELKEKD